MPDLLLAQPGALRVGTFIALLALMGLAETYAPRRARRSPRAWHGLHNLSLLAVGAGVARLVLPAGAVGVASFAEARGLGLLHHIQWSAWGELLLSLALLDLAIWAQHVASHRVRVLWRFHQVHHADLDLDVTSGVRFHPIEILGSLAWKAALIVVVGISPLAVLLFEVLLNGMAVFNHANARLPRALDAWLRRVVVTPDVHRVHHSVVPEETGSNFGFNLVLWDHLFGTYRAQPAAGHRGMVLGLPGADANRAEAVEAAAGVAGMLLMPFRRLALRRDQRADERDRNLGPAPSDGAGVCSGDPRPNPDPDLPPCAPSSDSTPPSRSS
ncbi:MAG: sterol desaturase family protein [Planctomycetota bacterium]